MEQQVDGRRSSRSILIMTVSFVLLTAIDLGTKEWALENLSAPRRLASGATVCEPDSRGRVVHRRQQMAPQPFVDGVINLYYAENCGAAFSMMGTAPRWLRLGLFGAASVGAVLALVTMFVRGARGPMFAAGVPLIVSGAVGNNLVDRLRHGFVVDFLQVHPDLFEYPIFNVADIWIAIGVGLILIDGFRTKQKATPNPSGAAASSLHQSL